MKSQNSKFISKYALSKTRGAIYGFWLSTGLANILKRRRIKKLNQIFDGALFNEGKSLKILEIGCGSGKDFIQFFKGSGHQLWGLDVFETGIVQDNFTFVNANANSIPFPDGYFDIVVSIGVFEHIAPIEDLCASISEAKRVSKKFCIMVPSISTIFEPHFWGILWQLSKMKPGAPRGTNYFSDDAWSSFRGFAGATIKRVYYIPLMISNLFIHNA